MAENHAEAGVIAIVFADARDARAGRRTVRRLMRSHALCAEHSAIVSRAADGGIAITMRRSFLLAGAVGGLAWGFVLGSVVFQPTLGAMAGVLCGGVVGGLTAAGMDPAWLRHAASALRAGESALVLAVAHGQDADAVALVAGDSGRVILQAHARPWGPDGETDIGETG